ncbi:unnamed protein product [Scytosiphon promiscuus]
MAGYLKGKTGRNSPGTFQECSDHAEGVSTPHTFCMSPAAALCFVASTFAQDRTPYLPAGSCADRLSATVRTCGFIHTFSIHTGQGSAAPECDIGSSRPYIGMASVAGNAASSVWVTHGKESTNRCPAGGPLSSPQGFLLANPPGPYTCLRSVRHRSAAMLSFHLDRLWDSAEATGLGPSARAEGRQSLDRRTTEAIARAMESFLEENASLAEGCPECMTTVLYTNDGSAEDSAEDLTDGRRPERGVPLNGGSTSDTKEDSARPEASKAKTSRNLKILAHAWPLPTRPPGGAGSGLEVLVAGAGRSLPEAKHSSWLRDRRRLDELKAEAGAQEVLLSETGASYEGTGGRGLLEGLTSNFFVVEEDGAVCTAPSGVLEGAMRQLVPSICEEESVAFRFETPDMSRAPYWREAFLTGTGRILAPIDALMVPEREESGETVLNTRDSTGLPVSKVEISQRGATTDRESGTISLAETLRARMVTELDKTATRLF